MQILTDLRGLTPKQRNVVLACFLGWTLDSFDFFIIVFVLKDIAKEFNADIPSVTATLFLTLAMRPLGAFFFGIMADRFGRRPTLMINILFYSVVEFLSGLAPSLTALVILRGLYGIAMGGEWGVGASLTMETIPVKARGVVFRIAPGRLSMWVSVSGCAVWHLVPFSWLARNVYGWRPACVTRALYPQKRRGISCLAAAQRATKRNWKNDQRKMEAFYLCHCSDDRF
jgi:MFS transporter, SHS family, lactate transporter